jgi:hypothetical protein
LATDAWLHSDNKDSIAEYIAYFPDVRRRGRLYFLLAGEIMVSDGADAAMRWVEAIPDDAPNNFKLGLFDHVANMVAAQDPEKAANWFLAHRTQPYSEGGLDGIARRWAQQDAPAAMAWLLALSPDGLRAGERDKAIGGAFRKWIQLNQGRAEKWLNNHLPNPELDPAIYEAVRRLMPIDVAKSMEWARRLEDRKQRNNQTVRVGVRWRNKDPEAFDDWLKENEIPEETLQRIGTKTLKSPQGGRATLNPNPATAGLR